MSNPLRNSGINYSDGWFFVTMQVAQNKTMFGAIADGRCELNALGEQIGSCWDGMFARHPEAYRDEFVVMPNHFHAVIRIHPRSTNKPNHLSYLMQGFKSFTTHLYHAAARAGRCPDIGTCLWLSSYYDNLITTRRELENIRTYVRNNPARWDNDRFGPVTARHCGNLELLHGELVAYVASEGWDTEVPPRDTDTEVPPRDRESTEAPPRDTDTEVPPRDRESTEAPPRDTDTEVPPRDRESTEVPPRFASRGAGPPCPVPVPPPVISTFTSPQERGVLARCLAARRPFIHVMPGGIPMQLPPAVTRACAEGWALVLSPSETGTGVNKQRSIWCNRYVLDHAASIAHGHIRPGGTLETLLKSRSSAILSPGSISVPGPP